MFIDALSKHAGIFIFLRRILENNFKGERQVLAEHFVCAPEERVLDIGCGTGEFSAFFDPAAYTGIDIERRYIDYARKNFRGNFLVADATKLPFSENSFDKALIVGVLHHLNDDDCLRVLGEAKRVLKPDGKMLVMEDVDRKGLGYLTRLVHYLDQGRHIRDGKSYEALLKKELAVVRSFEIQSGLCPYQVFILRPI